MERLLTADDVAQVLKTSRRSAYRHMHDMVHLETPFRVTETALRAWIAQKTTIPYTDRKTPRRPVKTAEIERRRVK